MPGKEKLAKPQIPWLRVFVEGVVIVGSHTEVSPRS